MDYFVTNDSISCDGGTIGWNALVRTSEGDFQTYAGAVTVGALSTAVSLNNAIAVAARDEFTSEFGLEYSVITDRTFLVGLGVVPLA